VNEIMSYSILNEQYVGASSKLILPSISFDIHTFMGLMNSEGCVGVCGLYWRTINFVRSSLAEIKASPRLLNYCYDVQMQITILSLWHEPTYFALWIKVILAKFHIILIDLEPYSNLGLCVPKFYTEFEILFLVQKTCQPFVKQKQKQDLIKMTTGQRKLEGWLQPHTHYTWIPIFDCVPPTLNLMTVCHRMHKIELMWKFFSQK
jgi:hypothetical protein